MWICYSSCRARSLHWQRYDRIQLVRDFGSIILPIAEEGLINAGSPKGERFCKTKHLVVVDGDGSLWHNMRLPSCQTRPSMRRIWSEMFLKPENHTVWKLWQLSIIYLSQIMMILTVKTTGKSRGKSATTQRNEYCFFFCRVISWAFVRWRSVSDGNAKTVTRRSEEMPSVPQKPNHKA